MSFFELPPEPKEEGRPTRPPAPEWTGPAVDELGVEIAFNLVVAESDSALIALQSVTGYESGLVFNLAARTKWEPVARDPLEDDDPWGDMNVDHSPRAPIFVRFGLQFSDGAKVTNVTPQPDWWDDASEPDGPVLIGDPNLYRYGFAGAVDLSYWLWPLPPEGALRLVVEWPAEGIPETATELEAAPLLQAAATSTRF